MVSAEAREASLAETVSRSQCTQDLGGIDRTKHPKDKKANFEQIKKLNHIVLRTWVALREQKHSEDFKQIKIQNPRQKRQNTAT